MAGGPDACRSFGVNPKRAVRRIGRDGWDDLLANLRDVLNEAITAGGTTLRDFLNAEGDAGYFAISLRVYDRALRNAELLANFHADATPARR